MTRTSSSASKKAVRSHVGQLLHTNTPLMSVEEAGGPMQIASPLIAAGEAEGRLVEKSSVPFIKKLG